MITALFRGISIVCCLFVLTYGRVSAQDYKFNQISSENGLSQTTVNCIMQDRMGFMWFGTQEGLNRYDGFNIRIFKRDPKDSNSLSNNFIYTTFEDHYGMIWIGTNGSGLDMFDPTSERFMHYPSDPKNISTISSNSVRVIFEDRDKNLWIGTDDGLNLFDRKTKKFTRFQNNPNDPYSLPGNKIYDITQDESGLMWLGTYGKGICSFDPVTRRFFSYMLTDSQISLLYPALIATDVRRKSQCNLIRSLFIYDKEHLWVGTDGGGILVFNLKTHKAERPVYPDGSYTMPAEARIFSMCDGPENRVWLAVYETSLDVFDRTSAKFEHYTPNDRDPYAFASHQPKCIFRDRNGNMWVGTNGKGVQVYFTSTSNITHIRRSERPGVGDNTLQSSSIMSVMEDSRGQLWIGTAGGGLTELNQKTGQYTQHPDLSTALNDGILSLKEGRDGSIWVGTYGEGLNRYNPKTKEIKYYRPDEKMENGTILCIAENPADGSIWFGTFGAGIYRLDPKTDSLTGYDSDNSDLAADVIFNLYFDKSGNLWIGTRGAGLCMRSPNGSFKTFSHDDRDPASISNDLVYCITEDASGNLWIGTANGLNRFDVKKETFTIWYERNGLPSDNIYAVLIDNQGFLWLSHNKGISRFNPDAKNDQEMFLNYGPASGVQPSEFNQGAYCKNKNGLLYFGGQKGLNIINPSKLVTSTHVPPVYVTSYKRFGTEIKLDSSILSKRSISVTWRENYFQFEAIVLDYVDPEKNLYQYKLEGFDNDWSPVTTNRFISYTNLPGGDYTLHIRGADSNGNWNDEGISLAIHIQPPWWKTNWFYALCVITIIGGVIGFTRYRTSAIKKENRILEARVEERTHELAQKNADITASIQYAKRIQYAILPELDYIYRHFPESFIVYRPKDIVSGDFYWFAEKDGRKILVCADCTGHGVPGALMSVIGHNLLNQIVLEQGITSPDEILNRLNIGVMTALKQGQHEEDSRDGMDIAICSFRESSNEMLFAGALRPLVMIRKGVLIKTDSDRFPIGGNLAPATSKYTLHKIILEPGDMIYMFSDGYADQFGGPKGKKFMVKQLLTLLSESHHLPLHEQATQLEQHFDDWKQNFQQVDDVLVIGIRV
jgi:ligand-binding sensor domain-containing protein/serine phosphatase RsbU (regulator of sigma subunit)